MGFFWVLQFSPLQTARPRQPPLPVLKLNVSNFCVCVCVCFWMMLICDSYLIWERIHRVKPRAHRAFCCCVLFILRYLIKPVADITTKSPASTSVGYSLTLQPPSLHSVTGSECFAFFLLCTFSIPSSHCSHFAALLHSTMFGHSGVLQISPGKHSCLPKYISILHSPPSVRNLGIDLLLVTSGTAPCLMNCISCLWALSNLW